MVARRPYWKGYLKLSLVTCAVALYPATSQSEKTRFHQINRKTGNRLRQQMIDEVSGKPVEKDDKGRGYEIDDGTFVEILAEDLDAIEIDSSHTIDIESFVPANEIDKRYYERPYYLAPNGKGGEDAFAVIRDAMKDKDRVALARVVFANREHIVAIESWGRGMLCTTLRYDYEVRPETEAFGEMGTPKISKEMVDLAAHILDSKAGSFDPTAFKDEYELALRKLVDRKAAGQNLGRKQPAKSPADVIDLMAALRESLDGRRPSKSSPQKAAAALSRRASSRKSPKQTPVRKRGAR